MIKSSLLTVFMLMASSVGYADGIDGERRVYFGNEAGERIAIGKLTLTPLAPGRWKSVFVLDTHRFQEYFLAMKPFQCTQTAKQSLCHFSYGDRNEVSGEDWSALEYQLLFIHKPPQSVSLDPRNGMYWKLHREGDRLIGRLYDADLDPIIAPRGDARNPLTTEFLQPADAGSHPFPELIIE